MIHTHHRRLSATGYVAWVLGDLRAKNAMHVVTELSQNGALLAQNHYNTEFGERTAFFDAATTSSRIELSVLSQADRAEFLGRNGTLSTTCRTETQTFVRTCGCRIRSLWRYPINF